MQRNIRKWMVLRNWQWWKLYTKVKPLLNAARAEDEMKKIEEDFEKTKQVKATKKAEYKIMLVEFKKGALDLYQLWCATFNIHVSRLEQGSKALVWLDTLANNLRFL